MLWQKINVLNNYYHKQIIADKLPLTIGGGIGQSRLCMFILSRGHVGEVQASYWDRTSRTIAKEKGLKYGIIFQCRYNDTSKLVKEESDTLKYYFSTDLFVPKDKYQI